MLIFPRECSVPMQTSLHGSDPQPGQRSPHAGAARMSKKPSLIGRFAFWGVSLLIALLLAEYVTIPLYPKLTQNLPRRLFLMGFAATPDTLVIDVRTNAQGFTGPILDEDKPESVTRILTLGGSVLFNRRMTERMAAAFSAAASAPIELQGGALKTHTTRSSLIKYAEHFSRYHFDYVLIYHGVNDLWANHVTPEEYEEDYSHLHHWYKRNLLLNHSVLARRVYNMLWTRPPAVENGMNFGAVHTFERNIRELIRMIREDGGTPILMTFGWHIPDNYTREAFEKHTLDYNNPTHYDECLVEFWGPVDYVKEGLRRNNEAILRIAADEDVLLIDQHAFLDDTAFYFGDFCHLSEEGTDAFIHHIVTFFLNSGLLP